MRGELTRSRIIRSEWIPRFNIYKAELNSQQYILIIRIIRSQIAVIVVRHGARVIHGHVERINDLGNPLGTSHVTRCCVCRNCVRNKWQHKHQGSWVFLRRVRRLFCYPKTRVIIAATSARVQLPCGAISVALRPLRTPSATVQATASAA